MNLLENHKRKIVNEDCLLKYPYQSLNHFPKFTRLILSAKFVQNEKHAFTLLQLLSFYKAYATKSKKNILNLNLKKGEVVGCLVILRKRALIEFLQRFIFEIMVSGKSLKALKFNGKSLHWHIKDVYVLEDTTNIYIYLQNQRSIDVTLEINLKNSNFFRGFRLPLA